MRDVVVFAERQTQSWKLLQTFPAAAQEIPVGTTQFPSTFSRELMQESAGTWAFLAHLNRQKRPKMRFLPC